MGKIEQNELRELKTRCIEAAAKAVYSHTDGYAAGALEAATLWFNWIIFDAKGQPSLEKGVNDLI